MMDDASLARFMAKVDLRGECWLWSGATAKGYARFYHSGKPRQGHRVSYEHFVGPIPEGLDIDHLCRVRSCVNPAHLEPVTRRENLRRGETIISGHVPPYRRSLPAACPSGHPYDDKNTYIDAKGYHHCRACRRRRHAEWQRRNRDYVNRKRREWRRRRAAA